MNRRNVILTDGDSVKTLDPWQDETPGAWLGGYSAAQDAKNERLVPSVYAGISARVQAAATLPLAVYTLNGDKQVDDTDNWHNVVGFLPDPQAWLSLTESAICTYGRCYYHIVKGALSSKPKALEYWQPDSVDPKIDKALGLVNFRRSVNNLTFAPEEVLYVWPPDPAVELGPPKVWPLKSALVSANANNAINQWVAGYMNRGAIKAMLLFAEGMPDPAEAERMENWFNRFMRGLSFRWKVFNAASVKPTVVGDGLEALKGMTINQELRYEVHTALGTRHLLEDENYATASVRDQQFMRKTVVPSAQHSVGALNEQMLKPMGYYMAVEPERMSEFQEDEAQRATALYQLTQAGMPLPAALDVLGYDLSEEAQAIIDEANKPKEPPPVVVAPPPPPPVDNVPLVKGLVELDRWEAKVKAAGKPITWHVVDVPADVASFINASMSPNVNAKYADIFIKAREMLREYWHDGLITPAGRDATAEAISGQLAELISAMKNEPLPQPAGSTVNVNILGAKTAPILNEFIKGAFARQGAEHG